VEPELAKQAGQNLERCLAQLMNDAGNDVNGSARRLLQIGYGKIVTEPTEAQVEDLNDPHTNP